MKGYLSLRQILRDCAEESEEFKDLLAQLWVRIAEEIKSWQKSQP